MFRGMGKNCWGLQVSFFYGLESCKQETEPGLSTSHYWVYGHFETTFTENI